MNKREELANQNSCLNRAGVEEPLFILRANDPLAPQATRHWAAMAHGVHEDEKIAEAYDRANEMESWRARKNAPQTVNCDAAAGPGLNRNR